MELYRRWRVNENISLLESTFYVRALALLKLSKGLDGKVQDGRADWLALHLLCPLVFFIRSLGLEEPFSITAVLFLVWFPLSGWRRGRFGSQNLVVRNKRR